MKSDKYLSSDLVPKISWSWRESCGSSLLAVRVERRLDFLLLVCSTETRPVLCSLNDTDAICCRVVHSVACHMYDVCIVPCVRAVLLTLGHLLSCVRFRAEARRRRERHTGYDRSF